MNDQPIADKPLDIWAILEIMGHRRFAGHVTECQVAGSGFLRLDVPESPGYPAFTKLFSPSSVYAITTCTEESARAAAAAFRERPFAEYELPRLPAPTTDPDGEPSNPFEEDLD